MAIIQILLDASVVPSTHTCTIELTERALEPLQREEAVVGKVRTTISPRDRHHVPPILQERTLFPHVIHITVFYRPAIISLTFVFDGPQIVYFGFNFCRFIYGYMATYTECLTRGCTDTTKLAIKYPS